MRILILKFTRKPADKSRTAPVFDLQDRSAAQKEPDIMIEAYHKLDATKNEPDIMIEAYHKRDSDNMVEAYHKRGKEPDIMIEAYHK